ncbi:MAG: SDR family NAD(P)-dependent oxidoreductase [Candidatus Neptunochlamydia sp.]|nr:SDR family NAD(P)-dependent oxidoreductase [Candidatus Neptunochlamydia sp.]
MSKTILITGATDGIGLETARKLASEGHVLLLHGRSAEKLQKVVAKLSKLTTVESYVTDLSELDAVETFAQEVKNKYQSLDALINNAGVLRMSNATLPNGHDVRFVVNTLAPYLLTKSLLPLLGAHGRVINLSSAAQAPVNLEALKGHAGEMDSMDVYSQSKLAITMWSRAMANALGSDGPAIIAVNPGSLLGSKMVKEGFGVSGKDLGIGADILVRAALSDEFADATGKYFDNDLGHLANPHPDALDPAKCQQIIDVMEEVIG